MKKLFALLVVSMFLLAVQAGATVVIGQVGSNLPMPTINYFGAGPQTYGNYTWSSTNASTQGGSVYGYTGGYGYLANGSWDGALGPMAGVNDSFDVYGVTDTMTFAFASPLAWVGGFFNYVPGGTTPTTLSVWDTSNNLIESYNLTFLTGGGTNSGEWIRFVESYSDRLIHHDRQLRWGYGSVCHSRARHLGHVWIWPAWLGRHRAPQVQRVESHLAVVGSRSLALRLFFRGQYRHRPAMLMLRWIRPAKLA